MKKLLSLLSVLTIGGTVMPNVIAVSSYQKQEEIPKNNLKINECNNSYIEKFSNVESDTRNIAVDSKGNIFLYKSDPTYNHFNLYVLKQDTISPTKIDGINGEIKSIVIFNDDTYIVVSNSSSYNYERSSNSNNLYVVKKNETSAIEVDGIDRNEIVVSLNVYNDNLYIGTNNPTVRNEEIINYLYVGPKKYNVYKLKKAETTPTEINFKSFSAKDTLKEIGVTNNGGIYFATDKGIDVLKNETDEVQKFKEIDRDITSFIIDNDNNIYIGTDISTYILKNNEQFTKVYRVNGSKNILIDKDNNIYFIKDNNIYLLLKDKILSLTPTAKKIDTLENINIWNSFIDKVNNRIYFATSNGPYTFKNN